MEDDENMNEALEEWAKEHDVKIEKNEEEQEVSGMCEICGIREAKHVCIKCGRKVCSADFWTMLGICKLCLPEAEMKRWRKEHHL